MLQAVFQSFQVVAGHPGLGLLLMTGAGISNMVLDYVLIVPCRMGIGVAAITILLYGQFLFNAAYMGFSIGISPIVGFQYGAGNRTKLRQIYRVSFVFVAISSVLISFSRTLVFIVISLLILPRIFGIFGAWIAVPVAEFLILIISGWMHRKYFRMPGDRIIYKNKNKKCGKENCIMFYTKDISKDQDIF